MFGEDCGTRIGIGGESFTIDGAPTHEGRTVEGLLFNSRMVQALFDDENPETRGRWASSDPGENDCRRGSQSPPVRWGVNTPRKRAFFGCLGGLVAPEGA